MSKLIKFIAYFLGILLLLVIIGIISFFIFFSPEKLKEQISTQFSKQTGLTMTIDGSANLTFYPWLGLKLTQVQIANPTGFSSEEPLAKIDKAAFYLSVKALLKKKIDINEISLQQPAINLLINKEGKANWNQLLEKNTTETKEALSETAESKDSFAIADTSVIRKFTINNAQILFNDLQNNQTIALTDLNVSGNNINLIQAFPVKLSGHISDNKDLTGQFNIEASLFPQIEAKSIQFNPLELEFQLANSPVPQIQRINLSAQATVNPEKISIEQLHAQAAQTNITGYWRTHLVNQTSTFALTVDHIDTATLTATPSPNTEPAPAASAAPQQSETQLIPVAVLRNFNHTLDGKLVVQQLTTPQLTAQDIDIDLTVNNQGIKLQPLKAQLYQGDLNADIIIKVTGKTPEISTNLALEQIQLEPFLRQLTLVKPDGLSVAGTVAANAQLTMTGNTPEQLKRHVNGQADFNVADGLIRGIDLHYQVARISSFINKEPLSASLDDKVTHFSRLNGSFAIREGIAHNDDLKLTAEVLHASGNGKINLPQQSLDYRLYLHLDDPALGRDAYRVQEALGGSLPLNIKGSFDQLRVEPNWEKIGVGLASSAVKQQLKKAGEQISGSLPKDLDTEKVGETISKMLSF